MTVTKKQLADHLRNKGLVGTDDQIVNSYLMKHPGRAKYIDNNPEVKPNVQQMLGNNSVARIKNATIPQAKQKPKVQNTPNNQQTHIERGLSVARDKTLTPQQKQQKINEIYSQYNKQIDTDYQNQIKADAQAQLQKRQQDLISHPIANGFRGMIDPTYNATETLLKERAEYGTQAPASVKAINRAKMAGMGALTGASLLPTVAPARVALGAKTGTAVVNANKALKAAQVANNANKIKKAEQAVKITQAADKAQMAKAGTTVGRAITGATAMTPMFANSALSNLANENITPQEAASTMGKGIAIGATLGLASPIVGGAASRVASKLTGNLSNSGIGSSSLFTNSVNNIVKNHVLKLESAGKQVTPEMVERFTTEAQKLISLRIADVVKTTATGVGAGAIDNQIFLNMDYGLNKLQGKETPSYVEQQKEFAPFYAFGLIPGAVKAVEPAIRQIGQNKFAIGINNAIENSEGLSNAIGETAQSLGLNANGRAGKYQGLSKRLQKLNGNLNKQLSRDELEGIVNAAEMSEQEQKAYIDELVSGEKEIKQQPKSETKPAEIEPQQTKLQLPAVITEADSKIARQFQRMQEKKQKAKVSLEPALEQAEQKSQELFSKDYNSLTYDEKLKVARDTWNTDDVTPEGKVKQAKVQATKTPISDAKVIPSINTPKEQKTLVKTSPTSPKKKSKIVIKEYTSKKYEGDTSDFKVTRLEPGEAEGANTSYNKKAIKKGNLEREVEQNNIEDNADSLTIKDITEEPRKFASEDESFNKWYDEYSKADESNKATLLKQKLNELPKEEQFDFYEKVTEQEQRDYDIAKRKYDDAYVESNNTGKGIMNKKIPVNNMETTEKLVGVAKESNIDFKNTNKLEVKPEHTKAAKSFVKTLLPSRLKLYTNQTDALVKLFNGRGQKAYDSISSKNQQFAGRLKGKADTQNAIKQEVQRIINEAAERYNSLGKDQIKTIATSSASSKNVRLNNISKRVNEAIDKGDYQLAQDILKGNKDFIKYNNLYDSKEIDGIYSRLVEKFNKDFDTLVEQGRIDEARALYERNKPMLKNHYSEHISYGQKVHKYSKEGGKDTWDTTMSGEKDLQAEWKKKEAEYESKLNQDDELHFFDESKAVKFLENARDKGDNIKSGFKVNAQSVAKKILGDNKLKQKFNIPKEALEHRYNDITIKVEDNGRGNYYSNSRKTIVLDKYGKKKLSTIIHELLHAYQHKENKTSKFYRKFGEKISEWEQHSVCANALRRGEFWHKDKIFGNELNVVRNIRKQLEDVGIRTKEDFSETINQILSSNTIKTNAEKVAYSIQISSEIKYLTSPLELFAHLSTRNLIKDNWLDFLKKYKDNEVEISKIFTDNKVREKFELLPTEDARLYVLNTAKGILNGRKETTARGIYSSGYGETARGNDGKISELQDKTDSLVGRRRPGNNAVTSDDILYSIESEPSKEELNSLPPNDRLGVKKRSKNTEQILIDEGVITAEQARNRIKQQSGTGNGYYFQGKLDGTKNLDEGIDIARDYMQGRNTKEGLFGKKKHRGINKSRDFQDVVKRSYLRDIQARNLKEVKNFVRDNFAEPIKDNKIKPGYVAVNDNLLSSALWGKASKEWYNTISSGEDAIRKAFKEPKQAQAWIELHNRTNTQDYQIPEQVFNKLFDGRGEYLSEYWDRYANGGMPAKKLAGVMLDISNNFFKRRVLGSMSFIANNRFNQTMIAAKTKNPLEYIEGLIKAGSIKDIDLPSEVIENSILEAVEASTGRRTYTGYNGFDNLCNLFNGQLIDTAKLKGIKKATATAGNVVIGLPNKAYNVIADNLMKLNSKLEKYERKQLFYNEAKKVRKDLIKKTAQQTITTKEAIKHIHEHPELKELIVKRIEDTLGDYNNFSKVERDVLKRFVPFYSWWRTISRHLVHLAKDNPTRLALIYAELYKIRKSNDDLADWQKYAFRLPIYDKRSKKQLVINKGEQIPYNSFNRFGESGGLIGNFSPALTIPLEATRGKKFFLDQEISNDRYIRTYKGQYYDKKTKKTLDKLPVSPRLGHIGKQLARDIYPIAYAPSTNLEQVYEGVKNYKKNKGFIEPDKAYDASIGGYYAGDKVGKNKRYAHNNLSEPVKLINRFTGAGLQNIKKEDKIKRQQQKLKNKKAS